MGESSGKVEKTRPAMSESSPEREAHRDGGVIGVRFAPAFGEVALQQAHAADLVHDAARIAQKLCWLRSALEQCLFFIPPCGSRPAALPQAV